MNLLFSGNVVHKNLPLDEIIKEMKKYLICCFQSCDSDHLK